MHDQRLVLVVVGMPQLVQHQALKDMQSIHNPVDTDKKLLTFNEDVVTPPIQLQTSVLERKLQCQEDDDDGHDYSRVQASAENVVELAPPTETPSSNNVFCQAC